MAAMLLIPMMSAIIGISIIADILGTNYDFKPLTLAFFGVIVWLLWYKYHVFVNVSPKVGLDHLLELYSLQGDVFVTEHFIGWFIVYLNSLQCDMLYNSLCK